MKYRLIASLLVVAVLALLAFLAEPSAPRAPSVSAPANADDQSFRNFKMP